MDRGRLKLRICLTCVVLAAVLTGVIYYCFFMPDTGDVVNEGTLVRDIDEMEHIFQENAS